MYLQLNGNALDSIARLISHYFKQVYKVSPGGGGAVTVVEGHPPLAPGPETRTSDISSTAIMKDAGGVSTKLRATTTSKVCTLPTTAS